MAKFYINGGRSGAGWIGGVRFPKPTEYQTDDPAMIDALRRAGSVVSEIQEELEILVVNSFAQGTGAATKAQKGFADMSHAELSEVCEERNLPVRRSKAEMIERLEIDEE